MAGQATKIVDHIYKVGGAGLTASQDAAVYLVDFDGHAALIDAGVGTATDKLLANVEAAGVLPEQIELLLITHCHFDHTGGARGLRDVLGCRVVMHDLDADYLQFGDNIVTAAYWYGDTIEPCAVDRRLVGTEEKIVLGGRVISALHIPGHSPGSVAYVTQSGGMKVVFAQDVHGPLDATLLSNQEDYQISLQKLLDLDADILCEGHYGVFTDKAEARRFIRSFMV